MAKVVINVGEISREGFGAGEFVQIVIKRK
jgi:hypothetical protein